MAFSWKKNKEKHVIMLKYRIRIDSKNGDTINENKDKHRLKLVEKDGV